MTRLDYLNQNYPIRKTDKEKESFRAYVIEELNKKGIEARVEKNSDGRNYNVIVGEPTSANAVFTAHYDTPAHSLFPNIMMPKSRVFFYVYQFVPVIFLLAVSFLVAYIMGNVIMNDEAVYFTSFLVTYYGMFFGIMRCFKNKYNYNDNTSGIATVLSIIDELSAEELKNVAFILFDNEEKGKKGSKAYFKDHSEQMKDRFLVNFDCVGNGDNILFIAERGALDSDKYKLLESVFEKGERFYCEFCSCKTAQSNSDHRNFPKGVACIACKKSSFGLLYTPHIHTHRDVVVDNTNIDYLSKNTVEFIRKMH